LSPFVSAGLLFTVGSYLSDWSLGWDVAWGYVKRGDFFLKDDSLHLWFLVYLLFFYAAMLLVTPIAARSPYAVWTAGPQAAARRLLRSRWRIPAMALPTIALLYLRPMQETETPNSFIPEPDSVLLYGAFFAFGALLWGVRDVLASFRHGSGASFALGISALIAYKYAVEEWAAGGDSTDLWNGAALVLNAVMIWALFFGLTGLLLRYLDRPVAGVRYVADASYWCYIVHFPLVVWLPGLLVDLDWAPEAKFGVVLATVLAVCFVTYELFERSTYVGTILNGRRYPSLVWTRRRSGEPLSAEPAESA
jgi:peptidoglycan/LPS O-acetylase OafA/YrhL